MAPHLRIEDWSRLYQPDGRMHLYYRRPDDKSVHPIIAASRQYCDTEDCVEALHNLVLTDGAWELWWMEDGTPPTLIASSESRRHWLRLLYPDTSDKQLDELCAKYDPD